MSIPSRRNLEKRLDLQMRIFQSREVIDEPPLTSGAVAKIFGVTPETVTNWADEGKLPSFRTPGGHYRFRRADVDAFLRPTEAAS